MNRRKNDQSNGFVNQSGGSQGNPDSNRNRKGESPKTTTKDLKAGQKYKQSMSQSLGGLQYNF